MRAVRLMGTDQRAIYIDPARVVTVEHAEQSSVNARAMLTVDGRSTVVHVMEDVSAVLRIIDWECGDRGR